MMKFYHLSLYNKRAKWENALLLFNETFQLPITLHSNLKIMIKFLAKQILTIDTSREKRRGYCFMKRTNISSSFCLCVVIYESREKLSLNFSTICVCQINFLHQPQSFLVNGSLAHPWRILSVSLLPAWVKCHIYYWWKTCAFWIQKIEVRPWRVLFKRKRMKIE